MQRRIFLGREPLNYQHFVHEVECKYRYYATARSRYIIFMFNDSRLSCSRTEKFGGLYPRTIFANGCNEIMATYIVTTRRNELSAAAWRKTTAESSLAADLFTMRGRVSNRSSESLSSNTPKHGDQGKVHPYNITQLSLYTYQRNKAIV